MPPKVGLKKIASCRSSTALCGSEVTLDDLAHIKPELHRQLERMLKLDAAELKAERGKFFSRQGPVPI